MVASAAVPPPPQPPPAEISLRVEVPATSANLGPGFDALAAALDLRLVVHTTARGPDRVTTQGEGAGELATGDDNLVWRALAEWCRRNGAAPPDVSLLVNNPIPLERGLGSSAAAAVAGLALGRAITGGDDAAVIAAASELEGHPDNAAAAVLGGLVCVVDGRALRLEPTEALRPVVCIPAGRQSTAAARALLPPTVPLADAAANGARTAAVLAGLAGVASFDPAAMRDVLHEPPRFSAMPATGHLVTLLREMGIAACLSGAGPAVLAVVPSRDDAEVGRIRVAAGDEWHVLGCGWDRAGAVVTGGAAGP